MGRLWEGGSMIGCLKLRCWWGRIALIRLLGDLSAHLPNARQGRIVADGIRWRWRLRICTVGTSKCRKGLVGGVSLMGL